MDIMEIHKNISYETMNTERKWTINLYSPDEGAPATTGEPALWRYVIYDDEDLIVETDFYSKSREGTLAFACGVVEKLEDEARYAATTDAMDNLSETLNPTVI
tara:strand:- start:838 stop:1146 length:309 start_codon:yes stop_codon:yes gene_type:complete